MDQEYYENGEPILSQYELGVLFGLIEPEDNDEDDYA